MNGHTIEIGHDMRAGEAIRLRYEELCDHLHIVAGTGWGKTTLMKNIFQQAGVAGHGCAFMTPAPDAIREAISLVPKNRLGDVILIDPADTEAPFAASPLALPNTQQTQAVNTAVNSAVNRMMRVCKKIWGPESQDPSWGPQLENVLRNCLYTLTLSGLTISELPPLLRDADFRRFVLAGIPDVLRERFRWPFWFWQQDYGQWSERLQQERTESTLNKVLDFLENQVIENIVGQKTNTLKFQEWMNDPGGKIILIHLSENIEGLEEEVRLLGVMLMTQIKEAVFARERIDKSQRKFFPVLVDEFHLYAGDDLKTLLERARILNVPFIIGHQDMAQLKSMDLAEAVNQTGNKVTGRVTADDARTFAPLYVPPPLAEQITERKTEEVSGHRAVRTLKGDVVGHLLHQGHADERVMELVRGCLKILYLASLQKIRDNLYPVNHLGIEYDPEQIPGVLADLNAWLFAGMQDRSALWQSLPPGTFWFLLRFFGITRYYWPGHHLWEEPVSYSASKDQEYAVKRWQEFRADGYAEQAASSGISRERLLNAAIAAVEMGYADFLSSLFPGLTPASIREAGRQSGLRIPACTLDQMRAKSHQTHERILAALLEEANSRPELAAAFYTRRFLEELSHPSNAVGLFLPALFNSYTKVSAKNWRMLSRDAAAKAPPSYSGWVRDIENEKYPNLFRAFLNSGGVMTMYQYNLTLKPRFTYHPELLTDNIRLGIIENMQPYLPPFLASLRLFAQLHCAQLALCQNPIWTMDSGVYEENKHTSTHFLQAPRQTPAEVAGLVESELINLNKLTGWCRVEQLTDTGDVAIIKYKMKIPFPAPLVTGQALEDQIKQIRGQSRRLIAPHPASVVAAEIRGRVALLRQPAAPDARAADALPGAHVPTVPEEGKQPPKRPRMGEA